MPPKKSEFKQEKPIPEKVYKFFSLEELQVKEQKYANHIKNLENCLRYIKGKYLNKAIYSGISYGRTPKGPLKCVCTRGMSSVKISMPSFRTLSGPENSACRNALSA